MGKTAVGPYEMVAGVVTRAATEAFDGHLEALERSDLHAALEQLATSLIWRAAALALRKQFTSPTALHAGSAMQIAAAVGKDCFASMNASGASEEVDSPYQQAVCIQDVLLGVASMVAAFESAPPVQRQQLLALSGLALGRHDATLAMAEDGHWGTIARERRKRSAGGRATAKANRESNETGWMADAWNVVHRHIHTDDSKTRDGWITLIQGELGSLAPQRTQLGQWLRDVAEAPNGPLKSRARSRSA